jgi:pimeloyl-ACP methyl ester carboxylesterase
LNSANPLDFLVTGLGPVTVVALHGIQGTRAGWLPIAQALSAELRFVLPNFRGRGKAERGAGPQDYTLACYASELDRVIAQAVPSGPYVLAGWSLGVSVALAGLHAGLSRRPAALMLVSGSPCLTQTQWFSGEGLALQQAVAQRRERLGLTEWADDAAVIDTWSAIRDTDQRGLLAAIGLPAQVLHGSADADCPLAHGQWLAQGLGASLQVLAGVGHTVLADAGPAVQASLQALCAQSRFEEGH